MSEKLILRVQSGAGICRVEVLADASLLRLREEIAKRIKVPEIKQFLYRDGKELVETRRQKTLSALGLQNGDVIHVSSTVKGEMMGKTIESNEGKWINSSDIPRQMDGYTGETNIKKSGAHSENGESTDRSEPSSISAQSKITPSGIGAEDKKERHFKSFDEYLHDVNFNTIELSGNRSFQPKTLEKGKMLKIPPTVTLKHQPYRHVDHLELMNVEEVKSFVDYWRNDLDMETQRFGWMFGYYREDSHYPMGIRAVCEAIYEPPQHGMSNQFVLLNDPDLESVTKIANRLGLERIGLIFTHLPRDEFLSPQEVMHIARLQLMHSTTSHYTGYSCSKFVTCTISLDEKAHGEPVANAFMVSDLGTALVRDGLLENEQADTSHMVIRPATSNELLPQILESGKETARFDVDWLIVRVNESAPKEVRSIFSHNHFVRENRVSIPVGRTICKEYFNHPSMNRVNRSPSYHRFANFHLLIFLYKTFDLETVYTICDAIMSKGEVELEEVIRTL